MTGRLIAVREGVAIPGSFPAPLLGAVVGERLHLVSGLPGPGAVHLALDADGAVVIDAHPLAVPGVHAVAASPEELLVVCPLSTDGSSAAALVGLDADGAVRHRTELELGVQLAQWPRLAAYGEVATAAWVTGESELWIAEWNGALVGDPVPLDAGVDAVTALDVAAGPLGTLVLTVGAAGSVQLVCGTARRPLAVDGPVSVARAYAMGESWAVAWIRGDRHAGVQRFGADLTPLGPPVEPPPPAPGERMRDIRLVPDGERAVVVAQYATTRRGPVMSGHSPMSQVLLRETLAPLGAADDASYQLSEAAVTAQAAGWIGDRLVVAHGAQRPVVSVLAYEGWVARACLPRARADSADMPEDQVP